MPGHRGIDPLPGGLVDRHRNEAGLDAVRVEQGKQPVEVMVQHRQRPERIEVALQGDDVGPSPFAEIVLSRVSSACQNAPHCRAIAGKRRHASDSKNRATGNRSRYSQSRSGRRQAVAAVRVVD